MQRTYETLADRAIGEGQRWIGIAGGPGAGKSTVANAVAATCLSRGVEAVVLPMDGFHYSRARLKELDPPEAASLLPRRGAPPTFDAEGFVDALVAAKRRGAASLPAYSRALSDPVPDAVCLEPSHRVVLVEGNYLFLGFLDDDDDDEMRRWRGLCPLFDDRWFVSPRGGVKEQRARLVRRHLETWSDAKTKRVVLLFRGILTLPQGLGR
ncbi:hypothetical protein CTAYLR_005031 [Chrysophaeum taylorii]|uniref:Phosphoribulokinase/uridine kinase domain-containing protein n=1 Tax=Chrysophaeum taylorii TaxID=2483200 RepID=A0AAD7UBU3_9STRA|nr:hypothetical protein CTAYLR_005031 [Chrysophaeum taylorii]